MAVRPLPTLPASDRALPPHNPYALRVGPNGDRTLYAQAPAVPCAGRSSPSLPPPPGLLLRVLSDSHQPPVPSMPYSTPAHLTQLKPFWRIPFRSSFGDMLGTGVALTDHSNSLICLVSPRNRDSPFLSITPSSFLVLSFISNCV